MPDRATRLPVSALGSLTLHLSAARSFLGLCLGKTPLLGWRLVKPAALELRDYRLRVPLPSLYQSFKIPTAEIPSSIFQCDSSRLPMGARAASSPDSRLRESAQY
jgi:hypothetical protein